MERMEEIDVPQDVPEDITDHLEVPALPESLLVSDDLIDMKKTGRVSATPADSLMSLEQHLLEMSRRKVEELESFERLVLPDVDIHDAESRSRSHALNIVMEAVDAMGGLDALTSLRYISYSDRFHKNYGTRSKFAEFLPGGARIVYNGERGWIDVFGQGFPLKDKGLREVQRRAERWDFLSRYLGDGVQLTYIGFQTNPYSRSHHVILVEDMKYGSPPFRALFDSQTSLLVAEQFQVGDRWREKRFLDYKLEGRALVWHQIEDGGHLQPVRYNSFDENVFAISKPDTGWGRLDTYESVGVLWVDAKITNMAAAGTRILPGATNKVNGRQRSLVQQQVRDLIVDDISRRGLVQNVLPLKDASNIRGLLRGDYILEIILENRPRQGLHYQARLYEAKSSKQIMQDGPPNTNYAGIHWGSSNYVGIDTTQVCRYYSLETFTIEDDLAYINRDKLLQLALRTYDKTMWTVKLYDKGQRKNYPYLRGCCYCQSP